VFLESIQKSDDVFGLAKFNHIDGLPPEKLDRLRKTAQENAGKQSRFLTYQIDADEAASS